VRTLDGGGRGTLLALLLPALLGFMLALSAPLARADVASGQQALDKGDYARAMAEWQSAADKGDAEGQLGLGKLYEFGLGDLAQNYKRADFWYRKAADQNSAEAQYRLALIWAVGGDEFPPDLAEAYKWLTLAAESKGVWGTRAAELKPQFDRLVGPGDQAKAKKLAADWKDEHAKTAAPNPPAQTPGSTAPAPLPSSKCAGWPFPTLPCTEDFPAFPGTAPPQHVVPPVPAQNEPGVSTATAAPPPSGEPPLDQLNQALAQIDCAALRSRVSGQSLAAVSGTVPDEQQRVKVTQLVARLFPGSHPEITLEIVPPPLCHSLVALNAMRLAGLLSDGNLSLRPASGATLLHEGDLIQVEVHGPVYPVNLRIDYFSLGGQVLHLWPNNDETTVSFAAGETRIFGQPGAHKVWAAGGAPFGTEFISVIATSASIDLGAARRPVEPAEDYLRDLRAALGRVGANPSRPNIAAVLMVHTSPH
jgi:hypothetical protein